MISQQNSQPHYFLKNQSAHRFSWCILGQLDIVDTQGFCTWVARLASPFLCFSRAVCLRTECSLVLLPLDRGRPGNLSLSSCACAFQSLGRGLLQYTAASGLQNHPMPPALPWHASQNTVKQGVWGPKVNLFVKNEELGDAWLSPFFLKARPPLTRR